MRQDVLSQIRGPREGLAARFADVFFLARVDQHVRAQVIGPREGLAARLADVRPLTRVGHFVVGQGAGI